MQGAEESSLPANVVKLARRLLNLDDGRKLITLTVEGGQCIDWTVTELGKVERPSTNPKTK